MTTFTLVAVIGTFSEQQGVCMRCYSAFKEGVTASLFKDKLHLHFFFFNTEINGKKSSILLNDLFTLLFFTTYFPTYYLQFIPVFFKLGKHRVRISKPYPNFTSI